MWSNLARKNGRNSRHFDPTLGRFGPVFAGEDCLACGWVNSCGGIGGDDGKGLSRVIDVVACGLTWLV
jgi:hypothetical protein